MSASSSISLQQTSHLYGPCYSSSCSSIFDRRPAARLLLALPSWEVRAEAFEKREITDLIEPASELRIGLPLRTPSRFRNNF